MVNQARSHKAGLGVSAPCWKFHAAAVVRPIVGMRMDADISAALRDSGKGWQTRVNTLLRQAVEQGRF